MALAGAALATGAGVVSQSTETTVPAQVKPMELYGYGGTPIRTTQSISTASTSTTSTALQLATTTETESNDDRSEASNVGVDVEVSGTLEPAEVDWFAFDLAQGQRVSATLDRQRERGVTAFIVYGPDGKYRDLVYLGNGKPSVLTVEATTAGTHYAEVVDIQSGDGKYTLTIETVLSDGDTSDGTTDNGTTDNGTSDGTTDNGTTDDTANETPVIDDPSIEFGTQGYGELGYGGLSA